MKCSATKQNGLRYTFKAKVNGRCGFHKLKGAVSHAPDPSAQNLPPLAHPFNCGSQAKRVAYDFVFVDIEEEVSLSFS